MTNQEPVSASTPYKHPLQFMLTPAGENHTLSRSKILGEVRYGNEFSPAGNAKGHPALSLAMRPDDKHGEFSEVWYSDNEVISGTENGLFYAHDGVHLFCTGTIAQASLGRSQTRSAYIHAFKLMERLGYHQLFRMWNFIPDINRDHESGLETYREFCAGRAEAFAEFSNREHLQMPAATGIGMTEGQISFYFLATSSHHVTHLENPRQIPAYTYPRVYGPKSPSFARATVLRQEHVSEMSAFVSGTASIIGHNTVFASDIEKQCDVTLENIALLISQKNLADHMLNGSGKLSDMRGVKVFVRHATDIPYVRQRCQEVFPENAFNILNVDVCRADLLVEIEGIVPLQETANAG